MKHVTLLASLFVAALFGINLASAKDVDSKVEACHKDGRDLWGCVEKNLTDPANDAKITDMARRIGDSWAKVQRDAREACRKAHKDAQDGCKNSKDKCACHKAHHEAQVKCDDARHAAMATHQADVEKIKAEVEQFLAPCEAMRKAWDSHCEGCDPSDPIRIRVALN